MSLDVLYHATSQQAWQKIQADGQLAEGSFLTDCVEVVCYYAETITDEEQMPVILEITQIPEALEVDYPSFDEPLTLFRDEYADSEDEWHEMLESGEIPYPENKDDWSTSLDVVRSVKTGQAISVAHIVVNQHLTELCG